MDMFAGTDKVFISGERLRLGTNSMMFWDCLDIS